MSHTTEPCVYVCSSCENPLYSSSAGFVADGVEGPTFREVLRLDSVSVRTSYSYGLKRQEVLCCKVRAFHAGTTLLSGVLARHPYRVTLIEKIQHIHTRTSPGARVFCGSCVVEDAGVCAHCSTITQQITMHGSLPRYERRPRCTGVVSLCALSLHFIDGSNIRGYATSA